MEDVQRSLLLDKVPLEEKAILVCEEDTGEAQAIFHCLLAMAVKKNRNVAFLLLQNSITHYHQVGLKFGYNLLNLQKQKKICVIEGLTLIQQFYHDAFENADDKNNVMDFLPPKKSGTLQDFFKLCAQSIQDHFGDQPCVLLIDKLDSFFSMNLDARQILPFYQSCHNLATANQGALITLLHRSKLDPEVTRFAALLSAWADLLITVKGLETGHSKDLNGTLHCIWQNNGVTLSHESLYHFKVMDRGVRIFAPGTSSAVL